MARMAVILYALLCIAPHVRADRLIMNDGRVFDGEVTPKGNTVLVVSALGTLRFARSEVREIIYDKELQSELDRQMNELPENVIPALLAGAKWAHNKGLIDDARRLYQRVINVDPANAVAREALGHVRVLGSWMDFADAVDFASRRLQYGLHRSVIEDILPILESKAKGPQQTEAVMEIRARAMLQDEQFQEAAREFGELAIRTQDAHAFRYESAAKILRDNPDGMYILNNSYPPEYVLLDISDGLIGPGPVSLAEPVALEAALHEIASREIDTARRLIREARNLESIDARSARGLTAEAIEALDRADAIVPSIARSYRVELTRRRITAIRNRIDAQAQEFDNQVSTLGSLDMSPYTFRDKIRSLIQMLDSIRDNLNEVVRIANPYQRDLVLELSWAKGDLGRVSEMRQELTDALDAR